MVDTAGKNKGDNLGDILLWLPTHGPASGGRPARTLHKYNIKI